MTQDTFVDSIQGMVMDGIRWLSDKLFGMFQGGGSRNALGTWFAGNWISLLVILIVVGLVVDWVVWILRWRHYKLWFGAKQEIPQDDPPRRRKRRPAKRRPRPRPARDVTPVYEDEVYEGAGFEDAGYEGDAGYDGMWAEEALTEDAAFMDDDWYEDKERGVFSKTSQDDLDDMFGDIPKPKKPKKRRRI